MFTPEGSAAVSVACSLFSAGVTYGIMTTKISRMEKDLLEEKHDRKGFEDRFVTMQHFKAVVEPIQQQLKDVGRDIKKILLIVSRHREDKEE